MHVTVAGPLTGAVPGCWPVLSSRAEMTCPAGAAFAFDGCWLFCENAKLETRNMFADNLTSALIVCDMYPRSEEHQLLVVSVSD